MCKKNKLYDIYYIIRSLKNAIYKNIAVKKFDITKGENSAIKRICYTYCVSESFEPDLQLIKQTIFNLSIVNLRVLMNSLHSVGTKPMQLSVLGGK